MISTRLIDNAIPGNQNTETIQGLQSNSKTVYNFVSLDLGTSTYLMFNALAPEGVRIRAADVNPVLLTADGNQSYVGSMIAAFHNGQWFVGRGVKANQEQISEDKIIRGFKLALYDYADSKQVKLVNKQLDEAGKNIGQLFTEVIRYAWNDAQAHFRREQRDITQHPSIVYLSVPKLASPRATKILQRAAMAAGLPCIRFVYEPMCAAACKLEKIVCDPTFPYSKISDHVSQLINAIKTCF